MLDKNINQEKIFDLENDLSFSQQFASTPLTKNFIKFFLNNNENVYLQKSINDNKVVFSLINEIQATQDSFYNINSRKLANIQQLIFNKLTELNSPTLEDINQISHLAINKEIDKINSNKSDIKTKYLNSLKAFYNTLSNEDKTLFSKELNINDDLLNNIKEENIKPLIHLVDDNTKIIEEILNTQYKTTLYIHSLGEMVDDFYYLNSYLFELEKLLSDKCNNNDRKNIIENDLPKLEEEKSGFQLMLEQNFGLTYEVLSDLEKTKLFKKNNEDFIEKLHKQFWEITDAKNSFGICAKMPLKDIITIDIIQTGGLQKFYQSKTIDLINFKNCEIKFKNVMGGIFSPCDGEGGLFNLKFKNLNIPLTNITPVISNILNNNWYVVEEVFTGDIKDNFYNTEYKIEDNSIKNQINKMIEMEGKKNITGKLTF